MKRTSFIFDALKHALSAGFRGRSVGTTNSKNVVPMLYLHEKSPRKLFTIKGFKHSSVIPLGTYRSCEVLY